jgi:hypothetical protein
VKHCCCGLTPLLSKCGIPVIPKKQTERMNRNSAVDVRSTNTTPPTSMGNVCIGFSGVV